jgi:DNA-binding response OmpR family regulator
MAKILVIDDEPKMRRLIVRVLTAVGHEMIEAKDGREGISLFHAHQPALLIIDILMPGKEGLETIRDLRSAASEAPIIAISGGDAIFLDIAKKMGADATIAKPFRTAQLVEAVSRLLAPKSS